LTCCALRQQLSKVVKRSLDEATALELGLTRAQRKKPAASFEIWNFNMVYLSAIRGALGDW